MNKLQKILGIGAVALSLIGCPGKTETSETRTPSKPEMVNYFFDISNVRLDSGLAISSEDFDKDGNMDIVVGAIDYSTAEGRFYYLKGDGKGHFTPMQYPNN